jgi:hypothetical protein
MNTFILAFSAQQSAVSQMLEPNFTAKDAKNAKDKKIYRRARCGRRGKDNPADLN